jgi:3-hydroxyacyl-CoA dehydrogenase
VNDLVRIERDGEIAVIVIENPPVNALAHPVRWALLAAIEQLDGDSTVRAIVLHGAGRNFIAGADVREFDAPPKAPVLNEVLLRLEACGKPVIAALHGAALGGGAETALASHYRCATPDVQLGFPEVKLGLLPGAGGTVRLPRLVGVTVALDLMTGGEPIGFERAQSLGLVDRVVDGTGAGDARAGTVRYARELLASGASVRRLRDRPIPDEASATPEFFAGYRAALPRATRKLPAMERIVQCVEAAVAQPFETALAKARELFEPSRLSTESAALRHLFFAERGSGAAREAARPVERVGVIGSGTMGGGIAISFAQAGLPVALIDTNTKALDAGVARIHSTLDAAAKKGRISAEAAEAAKARVHGAGGLDALADADLVIEAVFESMAVKQEVFASLGRICKPSAVLATNTSTLDVDAIAASSGRPRDVLGMHFFSPANVMRLVEIVRGRESSPDAIATALAVTKRIGKLGVVVGNCFGFVGNRMLYGYGREKELMLLEGATPERIDRAIEAFGMAMGPNAVGDLAGLDVGASVRREWKDRPDDPRFYRISDRLAELGRFGQKTGRGFYRYEGPGKRRESDPEVETLIRTEAQRLGVAQREVPDEEIVERCIFALVNEGARILEEGIARSAADIDVIWCNGYGFPRTRGGPMFYADTVGLAKVLAAVEKYAREQGERYWTPAPLLQRLASTGGTFTGRQPGRAGI